METQIEGLNDAKAEEDAALEEIYEEMKGVTQKLRSELEAKNEEGWTIC